MKMSTKARYGLYACAKLAQDYDKGFISTTELANAIYVSDGYLEQIVSLLKKEGVVLSQRGAFGGYKLSALPSEISVGRVLRGQSRNCGLPFQRMQQQQLQLRHKGIVE